MPRFRRTIAAESRSYMLRKMLRSWLWERSSRGQPASPLLVVADHGARAIFAGEKFVITGFNKPPAMQQDSRTLAGRAHQSAQRLVDLGHAGNLVNATKGGFATER